MQNAVHFTVGFFLIKLLSVKEIFFPLHIPESSAGTTFVLLITRQSPFLSKLMRYVNLYISKLSLTSTNVELSLGEAGFFAINSFGNS